LKLGHARTHCSSAAISWWHAIASKAAMADTPSEKTPLLFQRPSSGASTPALVNRGNTAIIPHRTPKLLAPSTEDGTTVRLPSGHTLHHDGNIIHQYEDNGQVHKIYSYDPECVLGWETLWTYSNSVFGKVVTLQTLAQSTMICASTALATFVLPSGPTLKTTQINYLVNFMMVFLAFITGIFVNSAFQRWQSIVQNLNILFRSIKALQNDLEAMDCPVQERQRMRRWGMASVFLTAHEAPENWGRVDWENKLRQMEQLGVVSEFEAQYLESKDIKQSIPWSWITMTIRDLSDRGLLPQKHTPAYCMLLANCDAAQSAIQSMDQLCLVQMPYQYVHMLAWLIHAFNIVNAIRCGVEIGIIIAYTKSKGYMVPTAQSAQSLFTYTLIMMLAPTIYQAFLTIALDIAIPFGNGDTDLPIVSLVDRLSNELSDLEDHNEVLKKYRGNAAG